MKNSICRNHARIGPAASAGSGAGNGLITGTRRGGDAPGIGFGEPRNVQLALKLIW